MKLPQEYLHGILIKRYKRFLVDVKLDDDVIMTAHTANTGAMLGCAEPGMQVWLYDRYNPKRKYRYSWELVADKENNFVGIHSHHANKLVEEAIHEKKIKDLQDYQSISAEVKYLNTNSRFDFLLSGNNGKPDCYLEVKNVTAKRNNSTAIFPDAVSTRGQKHLQHLMDAKSKGYRAAIIYCIQRNDVDYFSAAQEIDSDYAKLVTKAKDAGVEIIATKCVVNPQEIYISEPVKLLW